MRVTLLLFLFCTALTGQNSDWQTYLYADFIINGADTEDHLWLSVNNSILRVDKASQELKLLHFNNAPIARSISDLYQVDDNSFLVLSGINRMSKWEDGVWSDEDLQVPGGAFLRQIIGQNQAGDIFLADYSSVFRWDGQELTVIPEISENVAAIQGAILDKNDWLWTWRYNRLYVFDENHELVASQVRNTNYISEVAADEHGNAWVIGSETVDIWWADRREWEVLPNVETNFNGGSKVLKIENNSALISTYRKLVTITYNPDTQSLEEEMLISPEDEILLPNHGVYLAKDQKIWYIHPFERELTNWRADQGERKFSYSPWLPTSELMTMGLDPQGKIWVAGYDQPAYHMGGRWHRLPTPDNQFLSQFGSHSMAFTREGYPVLATGALFSFGFPESQVLAWNGIRWDTLARASEGNSFSIIRDVKVDRNNNFWVVRDGTEFFSVKNQGQWYRYKVNDLPIGSEADIFTCLEEGQNGEMWIGTNKGLASFDGYKFVFHDSATIELGPYMVEDIALDEAGNVWINKQGGVSRWNGEQWEEMLSREDTPNNETVEYITSDRRGGVWISLMGNGLMHYNGQDWSHYNIDNSALANNWVSNMMVDHSGRLWVSGFQSVSVYSPERMPVQPFKLSVDHQLAVYPNPGCCQYVVHWKVTEPGTYSLRLVNTMGQEVRRWEALSVSLGEQEFSFYEDQLPVGAYVLQLLWNGSPKDSQQLLISR